MMASHIQGNPQDSAPLADQSTSINSQISEYTAGDADSAYGEGMGDTTVSIRSSDLVYVYENGRRYQQCDDDVYIFPNDEKERDRLDMLHHIHLLIFKDKLYMAPIQKPKNILDMGAGTGIWAIDFADEFPNAHVLGVDFSYMQPNWLPPNCSFELDNIEKEWQYPPGQRFDYIHQRGLAGSIQDWYGLYRQALMHLVPGGWLEIQEFDFWFYSQEPGGLAKDSYIMQWQELIGQASVKMRRRLHCAVDLKTRVQHAGFTDVTFEAIKVPVGGWPKDQDLRTIGRYMQLHMRQALEALTLGYFSRILMWSTDEIQVLLARVLNEFNCKSKRLYTYYRVIYGRKPEAKQ